MRILSALARPRGADAANFDKLCGLMKSSWLVIAAGFILAIFYIPRSEPPAVPVVVTRQPYTYYRPQAPEQRTEPQADKPAPVASGIPSPMRSRSRRKGQMPRGPSSRATRVTGLPQYRAIRRAEIRRPSPRSLIHLRHTTCPVPRRMRRLYLSLRPRTNQHPLNKPPIDRLLPKQFLRLKRTGCP